MRGFSDCKAIFCNSALPKLAKAKCGLILIFCDQALKVVQRLLQCIEKSVKIWGGLRIASSFLPWQRPTRRPYMTLRRRSRMQRRILGTLKSETPIGKQWTVTPCSPAVLYLYERLSGRSQGQAVILLQFNPIGLSHDDWCRARADYLARIGDKEAAIAAYAVTEQKTAGAAQKLDLVFSLMRCGDFNLDLQNWPMHNLCFSLAELESIWEDWSADSCASTSKTWGFQNALWRMQEQSFLLSST